MIPEAMFHSCRFWHQGMSYFCRMPPSTSCSVTQTCVMSLRGSGSSIVVRQGFAEFYQTGFYHTGIRMVMLLRTSNSVFENAAEVPYVLECVVKRRRSYSYHIRLPFVHDHTVAV